MFCYASPIQISQFQEESILKMICSNEINITYISKLIY